MRYLLVTMLFVMLVWPGKYARAECALVTNPISNSTVYQYYIINCETKECFRWLDGILPGAGVNALGGATETAEPLSAIVPAEESEAAEAADAVAPVETIAPAPSAEAAVSSSETETPVSAVVTVIQTQTASVVPAVGERKMVISEIMSTPFTGNAEWVEVENRGADSVDLTGWTLVEGGGKKTALFGTVQPGNYLVFEKSSLNNGGDAVILQDENGVAINAVGYGDFDDGNVSDNAPATASGNSLALFGDVYKETELPTPAQANIFQLTIVEPVAASVQATAAETTIATAAQTSTQTTAVVAPIVSAPATTPTSSVVETTTPSAPAYQFSDAIKVNEFLADPAGSDDYEWIEIYNAGAQDVDLLGWSLDDAEGGSPPYKVDTKVVIKAYDYLLFKRADTKISLNNSIDRIAIIDPAGKIVDKMEYTSVKENVSWARFGADWEETTGLTPGAENKLPETVNAADTAVAVGTALQAALASIPVSTRSEPRRTSRSGQFQASESKVVTVKKSTSKKSVSVKSVSAEEAVALPERTAVKVTGQVIAPLGVFGKNYFYVDGAQIYFSGEGVAMVAGDLVEVNGTISESYGEKRINAKEVRIAGREEVTAAETVDSLPVNGDEVGKLLQIAGQIVEKKTNKLILADAAGEQIVYLKQGADIDASVFAVGDELNVTGVLSRYNDELRLLPRGKDDIVNLTWQKNKALGETPSVAGAAVPAGTGKLKVTIALLGTFILLCCLNGYWCWKHRAEIANGLKPMLLRTFRKSDQ